MYLAVAFCVLQAIFSIKCTYTHFDLNLMINFDHIWSSIITIIIVIVVNIITVHTHNNDCFQF